MNTSCQDKITEFKGAYYFLSNFCKCEIELEGRIYPSVEHAYMAAKNTELWWKDFCSNPNRSAGEVKKRSRTIPLRQDWEQVKLETMQQCLFKKFKQEPFQTKLKQTGNLRIEEGNNWGDLFWGVCKKTGKGENHLGLILMEIRKVLNSEKF